MKFLIVDETDGYHTSVYEIEVDQSDIEFAVFGDDLGEILEVFVKKGIRESDFKSGRITIYKVAKEWKGREFWRKAKGEVESS